MRSRRRNNRARVDMRSSGGSRDRLSALPEGVLHTVLSFLPAQQAVQTCVLARSWRFLWRTAPCIAIDQREFGVRVRGRGEPNWSRLTRFATNLLARRSGSVSLERFRLFAAGQEEPVGDWIRRGIECSPAVLDIATPFFAGNCTPAFIFPHLRSTLYSRLRKLRLEEIELDTNFTDLVSTSCPALVVLELICCFYYFWHIVSTTLEHVVMVSCYDCSSYPAEQPMVITAPRLTSLELGGIHPESFPCGVSVSGTPSLVRAHIGILRSDDPDYRPDSFPEEARGMLLHSLFNVTSLALKGFDTLGSSYKFPNLRDLLLDKCFLDDEYDMQSNLEDIGSFLQNAPCLEKLTFRRCTPEAEWKRITLQLQGERILACPKLKQIEFMYKNDSLPVQLLLFFARSLPDVRVVLTKL